MDRRKLEKNWDRVQRQAEEALSHAQDQASEALEYAQRLWDHARSGASDVASKASSLSGHGLRDRAAHAIDSATDSARPYLRKVGDRLEGLRHEALPYLEHLREEARPYLRELRQRVARAGRTAADRAEGWRDTAKGKVSAIRPALDRRRSKSPSLAVGPLLGLIGGGAGLMYLFNTDKGGDRRAMLSEKSAEWLRRAEDSIDALGTQFGDRIHAAMSDMKAKGEEGKSDAESVAEKIKDRLGRIVDRVDDLKFETSPSGRVSLSGPMSRHDLDRALGAIASIPGVTGIDNRLSVHEVPEGEVKPWSQTTRVMAGAGGAGLLLAGAKRGGLGGLMLTALGAGLLARSALDRPMAELLDLAGDKAKDLAHKAETQWGDLKASARKVETANHARS